MNINSRKQQQMNLEHLEKCAIRHHKGTLAIVEKLVGVPESHIEMCPLIAKKGTVLHAYFPQTNGRAPDYDYLNPYVMNGAFSLELKMKYLHYLETAQKIEANHNLIDISSVRLTYKFPSRD